MQLLTAIMGMLHTASVIWVMFNDKTGMSTVYWGTLLFFVGRLLTEMFKTRKVNK